MMYRNRLYASYVSQKMRFERTYDEVAYRRNVGTYKRYFGRFLPPSRDAVILDVGCGHGNFLYFLLQIGYQNIFGVDISEEQTRLAKRICPNVFVGDATVVLSSLQERFDVISGLDIIEHLTKDEVFDFLDAVYKSLKPGGVLLLQTPNGSSPLSGDIVYGDLTHEVVFNPNSLLNVLRVVGFERCRVYPAGPVPKGVISTLRWLIWQLINGSLYLYSLIEMGPGSFPGLYTRNMLAVAYKPNSIAGR